MRSASIGILGGGFGLYGYLPAAVIYYGRNVYTLEAYREFINDRQDLRGFRGDIKYLEDERIMIDLCDVIVYARRPCDTRRLLSHNVQGKRLIIGKPVAEDPESAREMYKRLRDSGAEVIVDYLFCYLSWTSLLLRREGEDARDISVCWRFRGSPKNREWKSQPVSGGGIMNYYGIHFIALAVFLGFTEVKSVSSLLKNRMETVFYSPCSNRTLSVTIDNRSDIDSFIISETSGQQIYRTESPFIYMAPHPQGERAIVDIRSVFITGLFDRDHRVTSMLLSGSFNEAVFDLWEQAQARS
jgi:hypothetical protein